MKNFYLIIICIFTNIQFIFSQNCTKIYNGNSTNSSDIVALWDGSNLYMGNKLNPNNIVAYMKNGILYIGNSQHKTRVKFKRLENLIITWDEFDNIIPAITIRGNRFYRMISDRESDILINIWHNKIYKGGSRFDMNIMYTIKGNIPLVVLTLFVV